MDQLAALRSDFVARRIGYAPLTQRKPVARHGIWFLALATASIISCLVIGANKNNRDDPSADQTLTDTLEYIVDFPLPATAFGEMGQRVQMIQHAYDRLESRPRSSSSTGLQLLSERLENAIVGSFPYIRGEPSSRPKNPFQALRGTFEKGTKGIVISLGKGDFRYACHLISAIRNVHHSSLPIQIAYAGDGDLPLEYRDKLALLGKSIEFMNLLSLVDDVTLDLEHAKFGIKPVAMLFSKYEQVILVDADSVFLQPPEALLKSKGYKETGTYLFHDRLLNQGEFEARHQWWRGQMKYNRPSTTLLESKVYTQNYSEEQDSGVVVFDKSRLPVLLALLHISWQNSVEGRKYMEDKVFGDKETYWFGLELCGVPYYFEKHYGNSLGPMNDSTTVCSNAIAHADEDDRLLWFNGALLANKYQDKETFGDFGHYMLDGHWLPQDGGDGVNCEDKGQIRVVDVDERKILDAMIKEAKIVDERFKDLLIL